MKNLIILVLAFVVSGFYFPGNDLSKKDRKFAEKELVKSMNALTEVLDGLSKSQLQFKSAPNKWSIGQCMEHLAIAENLLFDMVTKSTTSTSPEIKSEKVQFSDEQIIGIMHDRREKHKARALKGLRPTGKYASVDAALTEFRTKRNQHVDFIQTTDINLRKHFKKMPFGTIDAFQLILYMSAHTERHVAQIQEVMSHKDFPKG